MSEEHPTYQIQMLDMDAVRAVAPALGKLSHEGQSQLAAIIDGYWRARFLRSIVGPQLVYIFQKRGKVMFKLGCYESLRDAIAAGTEPQASMARFIHRSINQKAGIDR